MTGFCTKYMKKKAYKTFLYEIQAKGAYISIHKLCLSLISLQGCKGETKTLNIVIGTLPDNKFQAGFLSRKREILRICNTSFLQNDINLMTCKNFCEFVNDLRDFVGFLKGICPDHVMEKFPKTLSPKIPEKDQVTMSA